MTDDDLPLFDEFIAALQRLRDRVAEAAEPEPAPDAADEDFAPAICSNWRSPLNASGLHVKGKPR